MVDGGTNANGLRIGCGRGVVVRAAPLLRAGDRLRTLPDPDAGVENTATSLIARWPDGVELTLEAPRVRGRRPVIAAVRASKRLVVDGVGVRLRAAGAERVLVDGYHSWDWAGVRDAGAPGRGWWGAVWGGTGAVTALAVSLHETPRLGALSVSWEGADHLDAVCAGEPTQLGDRTGPPLPLGVPLESGVQLRADPISLAALDPTEAAGVGVPRLGPDDHHPRPRTAGWMSWNCLGPEVCGADVLEAATTLVPEGGVALLDDGWMPRWGDWHERDDLDTSIADLAAAVRESGRTLGVWVAPFLVDPSSQLAAERRDLLLLGAGGGPVVDARPTPPQWVLDASRRTVREHLAALGARLGGYGVGVLKLDFLYAGALPGIRAERCSGVVAMRDGMRALCTAFRAAAPAGSAVWACGAPAPPLVGIVDACRSGGDAVVNVPTAAALATPRPWFAHGEAIVRAQARNLAARAWLWGSTVPPDVDAVTLGSVGYLAPADEGPARAWLDLATRAGGPLLVADDPSLASVPPDRLAALRGAQVAIVGTPPRPARPLDPLGMAPAPMDDDAFYAWPEGLPHDADWE